MIVLTKTPLVRVSSRRPSSSTAKTMPANGVLKAAATPAAPPARIKVLRAQGAQIRQPAVDGVLIEAAT